MHFIKLSLFLSLHSSLSFAFKAKQTGDVYGDVCIFAPLNECRHRVSCRGLQLQQNSCPIGQFNGRHKRVQLTLCYTAPTKYPHTFIIILIIPCNVINDRNSNIVKGNAAKRVTIFPSHIYCGCKRLTHQCMWKEYSYRVSLSRIACFVRIMHLVICLISLRGIFQSLPFSCPSLPVIEKLIEISLTFRAVTCNLFTLCESYSLQSNLIVNLL